MPAAGSAGPESFGRKSDFADGAGRGGDGRGPSFPTAARPDLTPSPGPHLSASGRPARAASFPRAVSQARGVLGLLQLGGRLPSLS